MMGPPPPPPPAPWPLPSLTHVRYSRDRSMSANNWDSKYSRPNYEDFVPFPAQVPTYITGYNQSYDGFRVERYNQEHYCVRPGVLPQYQVHTNRFLPNGCEVDMVQAEAQRKLSGLIRRGTGVFHSPQVLAECNRVKANTNITEWRAKQNGDHEETSQNQRNKNDSKVNNGGSVINIEKEGCHDHSLPPGVVLPMEWTY